MFVVESTGESGVGGVYLEDTSDTGHASRDGEDCQSRPDSRTDTVTSATPGQKLSVLTQRLLSKALF